MFLTVCRLYVHQSVCVFVALSPLSQVDLLLSKSEPKTLRGAILNKCLLSLGHCSKGPSPPSYFSQQLGSFCVLGELNPSMCANGIPDTKMERKGQQERRKRR